MKKILFILATCALCLIASAQNRPEFMGLQISGNSKAIFAGKLMGKGYKYINAEDGYELYKGPLLGCEAVVMLVPTNDGEGITAVHVALDELNPVKMGRLYSDLVQKYMQKYADYKYSTDITKDGGSQVMFRKHTPEGLTDFVSIESKVKRNSCTLTLTYAVDIKTEGTTNDKRGDGGIGMDDL